MSARRNRPSNRHGCKPDQDVCVAHDEPLVCRHGCLQAKEHPCREIAARAHHYADIVIEGRAITKNRYGLSDTSETTLGSSLRAMLGRGGRTVLVFRSNQLHNYVQAAIRAAREASKTVGGPRTKS